MTHISESPCFIVGAERSGSTLLRLALDGHSMLSFPHEYDFVTQCVNDHGEPIDPARYRALLRANAVFRRSGFVINEGLDLSALNQSFLSLPSRGRAVVGGSVHGHFSRLLYLWPSARLVFLVRDPRAQSQSVVRMGWAGHVWRGVDLWVEAQREWATVVERTCNEQRHIVRYEDFVSEPQRTLEGVCRFLGVRFEKSMVAISERSTYDAPSAHRLGEWRTQLSPREKGLIDSRVFPLANDFGYAPTGHTATPPRAIERARLDVADRIGRVLFALDRYGVPLYLSRVMSNRVGSERWRRLVRARLNEVDARFIR